jgi:hypothetical protein
MGWIGTVVLLLSWGILIIARSLPWPSVVPWCWAADIYVLLPVSFILGIITAFRKNFFWLALSIVAFGTEALLFMAISA